MKKDINKEYFIQICKESTSMSQACAKLELHFNTFKKYAILFGVYKPNPGGKGFVKNRSKKYTTEDILNNKYPEYQTYKLKKRLYESNIKKNKCEICGVDSWNDKVLECELDHIDGNKNNHKLENLRILCPNCHSQTHTFRSKRRTDL